MKENLTKWCREHVPDENLIYRKGLTNQVVLARTIMRGLFLAVATDYTKYEIFSDEAGKIYEEFEPSVVGIHRSKSVLLPVMEMDLSKIGLKLILRDNFYDWCISVESEKDVDCDFMGLLTDRKGYFEGFPEDRIYKPYSKTNRKRFSFCLIDQYHVYTFCFLLRNWAINADRTSENGVRHGYWRESFAGDFCWCSECSETEHKKSLYCPNCGAKMDGGG